jgi:hypothetical protein
MADIDAPGLDYDVSHAGTFGNKSATRPPSFVPGSASIGDVLRLGVIPKGAEISPSDLVVMIIVEMTASVDGSFGYEYVTASEGTDDPDFFIAAGGDMASVGILTGNRPLASVVLDGDVYITCTLATANNAVALAELQALCDYIYTGQK